MRGYDGTLLSDMRHDHDRRTLANYPFTQTLETRFGDMDPNRHLNNTAIARLYEEARVRFHMGLRRDHDVGHPRFLVARIEIDYLGEGHYPAPAEIGLGVLAIGGASYRLGMAMFQDGGCIGLADSVMVHRGETGSAPIPGALRAALETARVRG